MTELAWHGLFNRHLPRRPDRCELETFAPEWTIINCPSFTADPARHGCRSGTIITFRVDRKLILIAGHAHAGENRKSVFSLLNDPMPETAIMPMHCPASHAPCNPADRAIFFGLSGTGKTTLSADPSRRLTCDACGVLPPIARLAAAQAMYHFLSGFTSRVAGTEQGVTDPQPAFSACFGAPFMLRRPEVYGKLLQAKTARYGAACWLVYTGWTCGAFGTVRRMPIRATRALLMAAPDGSLTGGRFRRDPNFGFDVPVGVPDVDRGLLDPRGTWASDTAHDAQAQRPVAVFTDNFGQYLPHIGACAPDAAIG